MGAAEICPSTGCMPYFIEFGTGASFAQSANVATNSLIWNAAPEGYNSPLNSAALYMAGITFQKLGDKAKGQQMCDKAIEMEPALAKNRQKQEMPFGL